MCAAAQLVANTPVVLVKQRSRVSLTFEGVNVRKPVSDVQSCASSPHRAATCQLLRNFFWASFSERASAF